MKMKEVLTRTGLTDRAVRHYIENGLLFPRTEENYLGRRAFDFSEEDVERLGEITLLRRAGFSVASIRRMYEGADVGTLAAEHLDSLQREADQQRAVLGTLSAVTERGTLTLEELLDALRKGTAASEETAPDPVKQDGKRTRFSKLPRTEAALLFPVLPIGLALLSEHADALFLFLTAVLGCILPPLLTVCGSDRGKPIPIPRCFLSSLLYNVYLALVSIGATACYTLVRYGGETFAFVFWGDHLLVLLAMTFLPATVGGAVAFPLLFVNRGRKTASALSCAVSVLAATASYLAAWRWICPEALLLLLVSAASLFALSWLLCSVKREAWGI